MESKQASQTFAFLSFFHTVKQDIFGQNGERMQDEDMETFLEDVIESKVEWFFYDEVHNLAER